MNPWGIAHKRATNDIKKMPIQILLRVLSYLAKKYYVRKRCNAHTLKGKICKNKCTKNNIVCKKHNKSFIDKIILIYKPSITDKTIRSRRYHKVNTDTEICSCCNNKLHFIV